ISRDITKGLYAGAYCVGMLGDCDALDLPRLAEEGVARTASLPSTNDQEALLLLIESKLLLENRNEPPSVKHLLEYKTTLNKIESLLSANVVYDKSTLSQLQNAYHELSENMYKASENISGKIQNN